MKTLIGTLAILPFLFAAGTFRPNPCDIMRNGRFTTPRIGNHIEIRDSIHAEYSKDSSQMIRSRVKWTTDCSFRLEVLESRNLDGFAVKGDTMNVEILSVHGTEIIFRASFKGVDLQDTLIAIGSGPV